MPLRNFIILLLSERVPVQCSEDALDDPLPAIWGKVVDSFPLIHKQSSVINERSQDKPGRACDKSLTLINQQHNGRTFLIAHLTNTIVLSGCDFYSFYFNSCNISPLQKCYNFFIRHSLRSLSRIKRVLKYHSLHYVNTFCWLVDMSDRFYLRWWCHSV